MANNSPGPEPVLGQPPDYRPRHAGIPRELTVWPKGFTCCQNRCRVVGINTQHCDGCHASFRSTALGDWHRVGEFDVDRRCRTAEEMRAAGHDQDRFGRWYTPMPDDVRAKAEAGWAE